jgi:hypothetical protein
LPSQGSNDTEAKCDRGKGESDGFGRLLGQRRKRAKKCKAKLCGHSELQKLIALTVDLPTDRR